MKEQEIFELIEELTDEEYIERDYLYGYNGSTLSTMDYDVIRSTFKDVHYKLEYNLKLFYLKDEIDLLQRIKTLLNNELKSLEKMYDFYKWLLSINIDSDDTEADDHLEGMIFVFKTKVNYVKELLDLIDSFIGPTTDDIKLESMPFDTFHDEPNVSNSKAGLSVYNDVKAFSKNQMEQIGEFMNEVHLIDVYTQTHYLIDDLIYTDEIRYLKDDDMPAGTLRKYKSKLLYVINTSSNGRIRTLYNNAKISLALLSQKNLKNIFTLLQTYSYKQLDKEIRSYYMKFIKGEAQPMQDTDFLHLLQGRLKNDVSNSASFTIDFLDDLLEDVGNKKEYMNLLTEDIKSLLDDAKNGSVSKEVITPQASGPSQAVFAEKRNVEENSKSKVDIETLSNYFHPNFKGRGNNNYDYFTQLLEDVQLLKTRKEVGQVALMIYESKYISSLKPNDFTPWYRIFCECIGKKMGTYKKSHLRTPKEMIKKTFYYIEPKNA